MKGRCRYCKEKISFKYPLIEILGGLMALFCLCYSNYQTIGLVNYAIVMVLITIAMIDREKMIIPNSLTLILFILGLVKMSLSSYYLFDRIVGMFCVSSIMFLLNFLIKNCFGGGDIKLMMATGFLLGIKYVILAFIIAIIIGGISAGYILLKNKSNDNKYMAFGPFLCIGIFLSMFYGQKILMLYLSLI